MCVQVSILLVEGGIMCKELVNYTRVQSVFSCLNVCARGRVSACGPQLGMFNVWALVDGSQ